MTMKMLEFDGSASPPEFELPGSHSLRKEKSFWKPVPTMGDINVNLALRCPICQDPYQEPKQLNCGHSFCLTCLEGSQHLYSINCPICRKATCFNMPGLNGLRLLPNNYALAQVVEAVVCRDKDDPDFSGDVSDGDSGIDLMADGEQRKHGCVECPQCGQAVASAKLWYCADCEGGKKFCSNCMVERHSGVHRCVNVADVAERWRASACRLDALTTRLTPIRTALRQVACNMKNMASSKADELEKRSDFLSGSNKIIEDLLEKADAARCGSADCQRLIELECLLKKLDVYASIYGSTLTTVKETIDEASSLLNKAVEDVAQLEKSAVEYERSTSPPVVENVVVAWRGSDAKLVSLAGSFTDWKPAVRLVPYKGEFLTTLQLPKGRYEFKFFVDGEWKQSDDYESCEDGCGGRNNFVSVV